MKIVIIGAGDFAREVADTAIRAGFTPVGFYDHKFQRGQEVYRGIICLGLDSEYDGVLPYVIGVGDPLVRARLAKSLPGTSVLIIDPAAVLSGDEIGIGSGTIITAGCILTNRILIGEHCIINLGTTIGHDVLIGNYSNLSPGCHINGHTTIGRACNLGSGTVTVPQAVIGDESVIGAGAVVKGEIPSRSVAVGIPAKVIRQLP
jgi:sugar O-acyltransferase (sialic acid O-acetyltransferase NeuD family)